MKKISWDDVKVNELFSLDGRYTTFRKISQSEYVSVPAIYNGGCIETQIFVDRPLQFRDMTPGQRFRLNNEIYTKIHSATTLVGNVNAVTGGGGLCWVHYDQCVGAV